MLVDKRADALACGHEISSEPIRDNSASDVLVKAIKRRYLYTGFGVAHACPMNC